jgi:hypothetical protein
MPGDVAVQNPPPVMRDDKKILQHAKGQRRELVGAWTAIWTDCTRAVRSPEFMDQIIFCNWMDSWRIKDPVSYARTPL